jgi:hypothetical protein
MIGNRNVTLAIGVYDASNEAQSKDKEISIQLSETNTKNPVKNVTFLVKAMKQGNILFEHTFKSDKGSMVLVIVPKESGEVYVHEGQVFTRLLRSLFGNESDSAIITGPIFYSGGLYQFHVEILTADSYANKIEPPIKYEPAISIVETTAHPIQLEGKSEQVITIISYYDQISDFAFDSSDSSIRFSMPFDWSEKNIDQISVVHEEIRMPKSFSEIIATKYDAFVNDIQLPQNTVTIDDYSSSDRIVHIVLNKLEIMELAKLNTVQQIEFVIKPSDKPGFPLSAYTRNAQYKVELSWDPLIITSSSKAKFVFGIRDPYLITNKMVSTSYDFVIVSGDNEIFRQSGITKENAMEEIEVSFPDNVTSPVLIKFENLGGNNLASVEFLSVIKNISAVQPKFPIKLSSSMREGNQTVAGRYDVDLTWVPPFVSTDQQTEFIFTIKDRDNGLPIPESKYDFVILQNDKEIYRKSGVAPAGGYFESYTFAKGQEGPATIKLENINNSNEFVDIPIVVTPEFLNPIPALVIMLSLVAIYKLKKNVFFRF